MDGEVQTHIFRGSNSEGALFRDRVTRGGKFEVEEPLTRSGEDEEQPCRPPTSHQLDLNHIEKQVHDNHWDHWNVQDPIRIGVL